MGVCGASSAWFGGFQATGLSRATNDPAELAAGGWWAVLITFEGECRFWRFDRVVAAASAEPVTSTVAARRWQGPPQDAWRSSLDHDSYLAGVGEIRDRIRDGEVYQVNLCRVLSAPLPTRKPATSPAGGADVAKATEGHGSQDDGDADPWALAERLAQGNPAPYAGVIDVPALNGIPATRLVSASPELLLDRDGDTVSSGPIKGTGATQEDLLPKDRAENVMIVDLVRNDLQRVSKAGTVEVPSLLRFERHPGLVHLVSTVQSRLSDGVTWSDVFAATLPAGSVSGAPKSSALRAIRDLEPVPRGPYCGAIGYLDADRGRAVLAVGIRTFWWDHDTLNFGTGAGITWDSDPEREWAETELKAARLIGLASAQPDGQVSSRATAASRSR